jgi:UDP-N-acetylglucosamine acyltransferase
LGNHVVMANAANLAGHVTVDDFAIIGGLAGIHQFTRIGAHAFIGGASGVIKDIPPYVLVSGNFSKLYGLNIIGLRRRNFSEAALRALKEAYRIVFRSSLRLSVAIAKVRQDVPDVPEVRTFIDFIESSKRGVCR